MKKINITIILLFIIISSFSQSTYWEKSLIKTNVENVIDKPTDFQQYNFKVQNFKNELFKAPLRTNNTNSNIIIELPNELGEIKKYQIFETSNLAPELANRYPNINHI